MQRSLSVVARLRGQRFFTAGASMVDKFGSSSGKDEGYSLNVVIGVGAVAAVGGFMLGEKDWSLRQRTLPCAHHACCEPCLTDVQKSLVPTLQGIVGSSHVKADHTQKGSRLGKGSAMAHVTPQSLKQVIEVMQACIAADVAILPQGANTSLTGGSVVRNAESERPTVVINMRSLRKILPVGDEGKQVLCFAGAGISDLQTLMLNKYNRDSHSILGSHFLNPSVAAGVAYGSGGTQIRKGPAWTERALFCKVGPSGNVEIVNTLGLKEPSDIVGFLDSAEKLTVEDMDPSCTKAASWRNYAENVLKKDEHVSRFNADTAGPDCCRSEGKVLILATVHDTYPLPTKTETISVSCKDYQTAHELKWAVALKSSTCMSKSCEYFNRETFNGVDRAGRILIKSIELLGMGRLEPLWNLKLFIEILPIPFATVICDKLLYWFNGILPMPLPPALRQLGAEFEHHMLMDFAEYSEGEVDRLKAALEEFVASKPSGHVKYHICSDAKEKLRATLFRFVVAPAFRSFVIGKGLQGLSVDYALPKNYVEYPELPEAKYPILNRWVYSHFGCNVYHEDLVYGNEIDVDTAKLEVKHSVELTGGKLPAEHGHGTEYKAPESMRKRWMNMDPLNIMNPGVGGTPYSKGYCVAKS